MQTDLTPVLAIFCGVPLVVFLIGFFIGRWSRGIRITRVDQTSPIVNDARYTKAGANAPAPVSGRIRPLAAARSTGEQERQP